MICMYKEKVITLKTAKVKEHASGVKIVIIQIHVKGIATRHSQAETKLIQQVNMVRKRIPNGFN